MTVEKAFELVSGRFPFPGFMELRKDSIMHITETVLNHLPAGSNVLDFGAGSGDRSAVLQELGYSCSCCDDLQDAWHLVGDNRRTILAFAASCGLDYQLLEAGEPLPFEEDFFDMVMLHDVLEHLHNSPRTLLSALLKKVRPGGLLFVTVPNAANLRKRCRVLFGKTNYPPYRQFFWYPDPWRGHVREYVKDDLVKLSGYLGLETVEIRSCDHLLRRLPRVPLVKPLYLAISAVFPSLKDTWLVIARKPRGWESPRVDLSGDELALVFEGEDHPLAAATALWTRS